MIKGTTDYCPCWATDRITDPDGMDAQTRQGGRLLGDYRPDPAPLSERTPTPSRIMEPVTS